VLLKIAMAIRTILFLHADARRSCSPQWRWRSGGWHVLPVPSVDERTAFLDARRLSARRCHPSVSTRGRLLC